MSNEIKLCLSLSFIFPNHSITCFVFLHWFKFSFCLELELISSKINLLNFPDSLLAELISRHFGLFSKFSLWSFEVINARKKRQKCSPRVLKLLPKLSLTVQINHKNLYYNYYTYKNLYYNYYTGKFIGV